ncbi:hypothetical protein MRB53_040020 [Persea americana]|nr:hypothetical protein MRB53_040020 [Persea americana]
MSSRPANIKTEGLDMDSFFDFNQGTTQPSPATASSSKIEARNTWDNANDQQFSGPSHDYNQYKQQVGLPMGSVSNVASQSMFDGFNSGIDMGYDNSWSGIDIDTDVNMDFNNFDSGMSMFQPQNDADKFVNPNTIGGEEPVNNVRLWPGMHSQQAQQAALQKTSQAPIQQRQMKQQYQQHIFANLPLQATALPPLLNLRKPMNSTANADDGSSPSDSLPHIARMKKDEEEMDEDERLLASEEGKKLSSKERRQLRNKVSARAFRSRRKGEVAVKAQEAATLRSEYDALMQENERYRGFIETILRHPAFGPFMNDLSKDPSILGLPQQQNQSQQPSQNQAPQQQPQQPTQHAQQPQQQNQQQMSDDTKSFLDFDASQVQIPSQQQAERVGLATIPENINNFSKLNLNNFQDVDFNNFQSVNAFPVTNLPHPEPFALLNSDVPLSSLYNDLHMAQLTADPAASATMNALLSKLDRAASRISN